MGASMLEFSVTLLRRLSPFVGLTDFLPPRDAFERANGECRPRMAPNGETPVPLTGGPATRMRRVR